MSEDQRERIRTAVRAAAPAGRDLSRDLHAHPETGLCERRSAAAVADLLERHGFTVRRGAGGLETAFVAERGAGRPHLAFVAEYDALPELGHACGHNLIAASSVVAALGLAAVAGDAGLRLSVVGAPDEEGSGGKIPLVAAGVFDEVDAALMMHPADRTETRRCYRAAWEMRVRFLGRASHAVSAPEQGINALDAAVRFYGALKDRIGELDRVCRETFPDGLACPAIIEEGGIRPNIVPDRATLHLTLRAPDGVWLQKGREAVESCAESCAAAVGAGWRVETVGHVYREMRIDADLSRHFERELAACGFEVDSRLRYGCGSTDMGNVSQVTAAIHPNVAITGGRSMAEHTVEFAAWCGSDPAQEAMFRAAEALALAAWEWTKARKEASGHV